MISYYYIDNIFCKTKSINNNLNLLRTNYFYELIDNEKD